MLKKHARIWYERFIVRFGPRTRKAYREFWAVPSWKGAIATEWSRLERARLMIESEALPEQEVML